LEGGTEMASKIGAGNARKQRLLNFRALRDAIFIVLTIVHKNKSRRNEFLNMARYYLYVASQTHNFFISYFSVNTTIYESIQMTYLSILVINTALNTK
jgi:hypothetical protein